MRYLAGYITTTLIFASVICDAGEPLENSTTLRLAIQLSEQKDHRGSALEFRRRALSEADARSRGAFLWASALEYWKAGQYEIADRMLDQMEDVYPDTLPVAARLVRGETAWAEGNKNEASFYFEGVVYGASASEEKKIATRRLAEINLRQGDPTTARNILLDAPEDHPDGLAAIRRYEAGRDKKPWLGGLLGIIPGLGYMYAGEYANGFRSIILNGIFIYGMVDTANNDQWGAFAAITFFELTWFSGSIYGGIDASHRYNQRRLEEATSAIRSDSGFRPDYQQLPLISLQFDF